MITKKLVLILFAGLLSLISSIEVLADGTNTLGNPGIAISEGSGIAAGGTGMVTQPGTIGISIPIGSEIKQVLLYWQGFHGISNGDDTINVEGHEITGTLIGSLPGNSVYRADITSLHLINHGSNVLTVEGLDFSLANNGAGIIVIYDNGQDNIIQLRDGNDFAFSEYVGDMQTTVPQTFTFEAANIERRADLVLFFSSVKGTISGGSFRPTAIEVTVGDGIPIVYNNMLHSNDGEEWDTLSISVDIPAGVTSLTVQAFSEDRLDLGETPASLVWIAAALSGPQPVVLADGRMTGGGSIFKQNGERVTHGFEIHCDLSKPNNLEVNWEGGNNFHMLDLTSAVCTEDPNIIQRPPAAPFDTFTGIGTGRLNGVSGARIEFVFVDAGEPGKDDTAMINIFYGQQHVLEVSGNLKKGNQQAHSGHITASSALLYLRHAVGQDIAPYHLDATNDVTCDGYIRADDALKVLRKAVGQNVNSRC